MKTKINLSLLLCTIAGIAMTAFTVLCYVKYVNPDSESLFVTASPTVTVYKMLCAVLVIFALCTPFIFMKKCDVSGETRNTSFVIFSSSLLGFLFGGYIFYFICSVISEGGIEAMFPKTEAASYSGLLSALYIIGVILAIPCAAYFIMIALRRNIGENTALSVFATAPVLFCAVRLIYTFMQTSARVNAAGRKISIVSLCLCVFFFLYEANLLSFKKGTDLDRKTLEKYSSRYLASGFAAVIALFISRVSTLLLRAFWLLESGETYVMDAIWITMILYIMARISSLTPKTSE